MRVRELLEKDMNDVNIEEVAKFTWVAAFGSVSIFTALFLIFLYQFLKYLCTNISEGFNARVSVNFLKHISVGLCVCVQQLPRTHIQILLAKYKLAHISPKFLFMNLVLLSLQQQAIKYRSQCPLFLWDLVGYNGNILTRVDQIGRRCIAWKGGEKMSEIRSKKF